MHRSAPDDALVRLLQRVETNVEQIVAGAVTALFDQVGCYRGAAVDGLAVEVTDNATATFRILLTALPAGRPLSACDFGVTQRHAVRRVGQQISLPAFLQALRVGQIALWDGILAAAGDDQDCRAATLTMVKPLLWMIEIASAAGAESYLRAQAQQVSEVDRQRRDLLEDLLAGADVSASPKQELLRAAGLVPGRQFVVAVARPAPTMAGRGFLTDAVAVISRSDLDAPGLTLARQDEIVAVLPVVASDTGTVVDRLRRAVDELARRGTDMSVGVSTGHTGLADCADAYAEAAHAHRGLRGSRGVLELAALGVIDYLLLRADDTARRLICPRIAEFVADDEANGSVLTDTLLEYVDNDLNATASAKRMHMHVNTFYYRLDIIAKRAGCDLHRLDELQELVAAIKLMRAGT